MALKSPIGNVLGLGSAKNGTEHWWSQRVTAVALLPLTLWFVIALARLPAFSYDDVAAFAQKPVNAVLLLLLLLTLLQHSRLGIQVVVEDYLQHGSKVVVLLASQFLHAALAVAAAVSLFMVVSGAAS